MKRLGHLLVGLLLCASVPLATPVNAAPRVWDLTISTPTSDTTRDVVTVHTELNPSSVTPGQSLRYFTHVTWAQHEARGNGDVCEYDPGTQTSGTTDAALFSTRDWPPGTEYPGSTVIPATGTQNSRWYQRKCTPEEIVAISQETTTDLVIPTGATEGMEPGCYAVAFSNIHLLDWAQSNPGTTITGSLGVLAMDGAQCSTIGVPPESHIEWWMPDTYTDRDSDGDLDPTRLGPAFSDHPWEIEFNACALYDGADYYLWRINDGPTVETIGCDYATTIAKADGSAQHLHFEAHYAGSVETYGMYFRPKNWLIVSIGDSYASGEGNPDRNGKYSLKFKLSIGYPWVVPTTVRAPRWGHKDCHRSQNAGPANAARRIEDRDLHSNVTFVHLACTGAAIKKGLLGPYAAMGSKEVLDAGNEVIQLSNYASKADRIDALIVSIGGNDVGFGDIVKKCLILIACHDPDSSAVDLAKRRLQALPSLYALLANCLQDTGTPCKHFNPYLESPIPSLNLDPDRIFLTSYPDLTRKNPTTFCSYLVRDALGLPTPHGLIKSEMRWASQYVGGNLFSIMRGAANTYGWRFVEKVKTASLYRGICAEHPWFRGILESFRVQGDVNGAFHPNATGHEWAYAPHIVAALASRGVGIKL